MGKSGAGEGAEMRRRGERDGWLRRLFHGHPWLYILFIIAVVGTCYTAAVNLYYFWEIKQAESRLLEEREALSQEQAEMKEKIADLKDPSVIEKRAREELGLVKDGEVPYIK